MQKKKNTTSATNSGYASDIIVVLFCLIGFSLNMFFFNQAINQSLDKVNETPIGIITFKYKSAQRKLMDRVLWDRVKQESPVYNGDIIRTAELSEATITFADGNVMDLYSQTLAQVFLDIEQGAAVNFSEGGISINTTESSGGGITLTSGSATVQVGAGSALSASAASSAGLTSGGPLSVQVASGSANLVLGDGAETVALTEGQPLVVAADGQSIAPPSVAVLSPVQNARYLNQTEGSIPVNFNWVAENLPDGEYILLETSQRRDFSQIVDQISFTSVNQVALNLSSGTWYWRVSAESMEIPVTGRLQVLSAPIPTAIVPSQGNEYAYRTKLPAVRFLWTEDDYASSWLFEVADNAQMQNPVISQNSTQPSIIVSTLEEGNWFWRVTPFYTSSINRQSQGVSSSDINSFAITQQGSLSPATLVLPEQNGFVDILNAASGIYFSWLHDSEASLYTVTISQNEQLSNPVVEESVGDNYYVLAPDAFSLSEGVWYWAVTKTDSEGNVSDQSIVRSFLAVEGQIDQRTIFPPSNYTILEDLVSDTPFTWRTNLPYNMVLQISSDRNFETVHTSRSLSGSSYTGLTLPEGSWYWRIRADSADDSFEYVTPPKALVVRSFLDAPNLDQVAANGQLVVYPSTPVRFVWSAVEDATYYQFVLYHNANPDEPVYENLFMQGEVVPDSNGSMLMFTQEMYAEDFAEGGYTWTMRAMASETPLSSRLTGLQTEQRFSMKKIRPIELIGPRNGTEFDGLEAYFEPVTIEWDSAEAAEETEFILSRNNLYATSLDTVSELARVRRSARHIIRSPEKVVQLPRLSPGTYYWTVKGETDTGFNLTPVQGSSFRINPIEPYPAVANAQPRNNSVFDLDYFLSVRNNPNIEFSWNPIRDDSGDLVQTYILKIYKEDGTSIGEPIILRNGETSYIFRDLALLGRGDFNWTVEAVILLEDDSILKEGERNPLSFKIDIPQAGAPEENKTRELYGQ